MIFRMKIYLSSTRKRVLDEAQNDAVVMEAFDAFITDLLKMRQEKNVVSEDEVYQILQAAEFASQRHQQQTRRNIEKTPYIVHPLRVARQLLMIGHVYNADVLMAALLHDTIEDTPTSPEELGTLFGYHVQNLVQELSDDKSLAKEERKRQQIQNASKKSTEAALIVLADKLSNLSDLLDNPPVGWSSERISNYFLWAQEIVKYLPPVNAYLLNAVEEVMKTYWQRLAEQEYGI